MTDQEYNAILDRLEAQMAAQYLEQASKMTGNLTLAEVLELIQSGDDLRLVRSYASSNTPMLETIRQSYLSGGNGALANLSATELRRVRSSIGRIPDFDPRTQSSDAWLNARASEFATEMARQQGEAIQAVLSLGRGTGLPPKEIANQLLGKLSPVTGQRQGGVLGLSGADVKAVQNARAQLATGMQGDVTAYFSRVRRDRRFDKTIEKALREGRLLNAQTLDKITQRYAERLLKTRADTIAATEVVQAYNAGRNEFYAQLIADGVNPSAIAKRWKTRADEKVRVSHRAMQGQVKRGGDPFIGPAGVRLMHPGDMSMGAGWSMVANCRCRAIYKIIE